MASSNVYGQFYYWPSFVINFALLFSLILVMNVVIIDKLRQRSKLAMSKGQCQNEGHSIKSRASEKQLLLVNFAFLILTIPMKLFAFYVLGVGPQNMPSYFAGCYFSIKLVKKPFTPIMELISFFLLYLVRNLELI